jgi:hypothetical protein
MLAYYGPEWESLQSRMVGRWCPSFSGATGLQLPDTSGFGNHGVLTNFANNSNNAYVASPDKLAINFNGTNNFVRMPASLRVGPTGFAGTWSIWVYRRASGGAAYFCENGFYCFNFTATTATIGVWGFDRTLTGLSLDRWQHIALTFNGSNTIAAYLDGSLQGTTTGTSAANFSTMFDFAIGGRIATASYLNGLADDFCMFNAASTPNEVRFLYEQGRGGGMLMQPPRRRSYYAQLAAAFSILAESGSYVLSGQPIPLLYGRVLPADTGSLLLSGQTTPLLTSRLLNADQGSYAYSGTDAATLLGRLLDAGAAAYTLDGNAAGFLASRRISADTAAYLASGLDAGFLRSRVLEAGTGQYVLVASPVNLRTGAPGTGGAAPYYYLFLLGGSR